MTTTPFKIIPTKLPKAAANRVRKITKNFTKHYNILPKFKNLPNFSEIFLKFLTLAATPEYKPASEMLSQYCSEIIHYQNFMLNAHWPRSDLPVKYLTPKAPVPACRMESQMSPKMRKMTTGLQMFFTPEQIFVNLLSFSTSS